MRGVGRYLASINKYSSKLNSLLTYYQQAFIAQLVGCPTSIMEVMGSNLIEASEFFLGFLFNRFSCFITARITFTSILYPHCVVYIQVWCVSYTHLNDKYACNIYPTGFTPRRVHFISVKTFTLS